MNLSFHIHQNIQKSSNFIKNSRETFSEKVNLQKKIISKLPCLDFHGGKILKISLFLELRSVEFREEFLGRIRLN